MTVHVWCKWQIRRVWSGSTSTSIIMCNSACNSMSPDLVQVCHVQQCAYVTCSSARMSRAVCLSDIIVQQQYWSNDVTQLITFSTVVNREQRQLERARRHERRRQRRWRVDRATKATVRQSQQHRCACSSPRVARRLPHCCLHRPPPLAGHVMRLCPCTGVIAITVWCSACSHIYSCVISYSNLVVIWSRP